MESENFWGLKRRLLGNNRVPEMMIVQIWEPTLKWGALRGASVGPELELRANGSQAGVWGWRIS